MKPACRCGHAAAQHNHQAFLCYCQVEGCDCIDFDPDYTATEEKKAA